MSDYRQGGNRRRKAAIPLDSASLQDLALTYVARFATTARKLEIYLQRKLRERGWGGEGEPDVSGLVSRFCERGFVDDAAWGQARTSSLLARGYGPRRVREALGHAGVAETIREDLRPSERQERRAALAMARKRRFGPYGSHEFSPDRREKQLAALMRAGHSLDSARQVVDAPSVEALEHWASEPEEDEA